ncbi:Capsular polysaccharide biosynthesis protein [Kytococcus sedentarius]|uniref:Uncharacterized protein n=1 Tax=Kytococcus sedentarius (strain ATCC 14392 / DSM 20547 / JCM 11482 / CCUG 33030 / NBRC 15357 / NCTC 11040 / CCM 314 / 541) TaxID=478801 RepID=C7NJW5_KYTSD|nr:hypothetical protein Ksed_18960 [Kytococcus sedentarius DSM 20547]STX14278.1 Capsular polysaccharide biosynthesis protein [Kytococcus sedentarius]
MNLTITAKASTPRDAQAIANAAMQATADRAVEIEGGKTELELVPLETATLPTSPSEPLPARSLALGGLAGLALGFGVGNC